MLDPSRAAAETRKKISLLLKGEGEVWAGDRTSRSGFCHRGSQGLIRSILTIKGKGGQRGMTERGWTQKTEPFEELLGENHVENLQTVADESQTG